MRQKTKSKMGSVPLINESKFWKKVNKLSDDECWLWIAHKIPSGYGQFNAMGKIMRAHRVSWILKNGPIPPEKVICHKCDNPSCVNPNHLFLGTLKDNSRDMIKKGRCVNKLKTHCPKGHEYSGKNLYIKPNGHRYCKECRKLGMRNYKKEKQNE